ncbi:hypothetical protein GCM10015535_39290 [Streptomyces gelaticus]|uniref:Transposase n=1 Tax=Streptomyces gelaticus TaxID=285446 RepID=A0ABQ2W2U0_9ACTN|nr:hypothetical protein GCM10015535_39290 [Streptomyces gelaticus]
MIRVDAGMPTARFCRLIGVPERTWRRHQARARQGVRARGPWPPPARERVRDAKMLRSVPSVISCGILPRLDGGGQQWHVRAWGPAQQPPMRIRPGR